MTVRRSEVLLKGPQLWAHSVFRWLVVLCGPLWRAVCLAFRLRVVLCGPQQHGRCQAQQVLLRECQQ